MSDMMRNEKPLTKPQIKCGKVLLECIAKGQYTITYSEVAERTGIPARALGHDVGAAIGELSKHCHKLGLPLISVMVVQKGTQTCGEGFFDLCLEHNVHPEYNKSMKSMINVCMEEVKNCKRWKEFADYMNVDVDGLE